MKTTIFYLFFLLCFSSIAFSQEQLSNKHEQHSKTSAAETGLDIGNVSKDFVGERNFDWKIVNGGTNENSSLILQKLTKNLSAFNFKLVSSEYLKAENSMVIKATTQKEITNAEFVSACLDAGITYIKIGDKIKYINSK